MRPTNRMGALCLLSSLLALNVLPASVQAQKNNSKSGTPASQNASDDAVDPQAGITHKTTPLTPAAYEYLLDVMFPIDRSLSPALDYMMVLRFEPHLHPETQIVIRRFHSGKIDASISQVASGNAWSAAYQQIVPGESPNFQLIASNIQLRDRRFHIDEHQLDEWHKQIFPVLKKQNARVENLDKEIQRKGKSKDREVGTIGARYELWFIQLNDEEHAVAWDTETEDTVTGSSDLTQWMNRVRLFALGQVNTGSGPTRPGIAKALPMTEGPVAPAAHEAVATETSPVVQPAMEPAAPAAATAGAVTMPQGGPAAQPGALNPTFPQPGHPATASATPAAAAIAAQPPAPTAAATVASAPVASSEHRASAIHLAPAPAKKPAVPTTSSMGIATPSPAAASSAASAASGNVANPVFPQPGHPDTYSAPTQGQGTASPR